MMPFSEKHESKTFVEYRVEIEERQWMKMQEVNDEK